MFKNKTLKKSLIIHFGIIALTIVTLMLILILGMITIKDFKDIIASENAELEHLYDAEAKHYKWSNNLINAINNGDNFTGSLDPTKCDFGKFIYSKETINDKNFQYFINEIEPIHNAIHNSAKIIFAQPKMEKDKSNDIYKTQTQSNIEQLLVILDETINEKKEIISNSELYFNQVITVITIACSLSILIILFVCVKLYIFLRKEVVSNLKHIGKQINLLAQGQLDLDFECKCKTLDIIEIKNALNFSVKELLKYVQAIDYGMSEFAAGNFTIECPIEFLGDFTEIKVSIDKFKNKINYVLSEINVASNQVYSGADQVACGSQSLAQGATQQASSIEELSATINDISVHINHNADNSKKADEVGKETGILLNNSITKVQLLLKAIKEISVSSEGISKIIKVIDDIAFQTNILALNAAVEAARAGHAGKGFAVVADEVRNLAQKSSEAAKDTTALIESSLEAVEKGNKIAYATNSAFEAVAEKSSQVLSIIEEIALASQEQAASVAQISQGVDQISSVVQMNSATSEESAAASEELSGQANMLKSLLSQFKIIE